MKVYNTLSRRMEDLVPRRGRRINFFVCGPTVYARIHLGNARTFVLFDTMVKYLRFRGYSVFYLQNVTDIDDKIIKRADEEGLEPIDLSKKYFAEFFSDMSSVRADAVSYYAFATDFILEIKSQVRSLLRKKAAYKTEDGIYFDVSSFPDYGQLSRQNLKEIRHMVRHEMSSGKKAPEDFVLWKFRSGDDPWWKAEFGDGRPGWHIEDTAITRSLFGNTYDIHGAGSDLTFPHHEAEIAQMRTISGSKILAKYWLHTAMLNLSNEKMAKSTGNIIDLRTAVEKWGGEATRLFLLNALYRTELIYDESSLHEASRNQSKIQVLYDRLSNRSVFGEERFVSEKFLSRIYESMDNDFDTRSTISILLDFVSEVNASYDKLSATATQSILKALEDLDSFLGIIRRGNVTQIGEIISSIVEIRNKLRQKKIFDLADDIRRDLDRAGVIIEDDGEKSTWRMKR